MIDAPHSEKRGTNHMKWFRVGVGACAVMLMMMAPGLETASAQSVLRIARGLTSNDVVVLENRAVVVESNEPFTEISVAQPGIADVQPLSDRSMYILGRTRGATTLTLLGEGGRLISNVTVKVRPDLVELKERLNTLLPDEPIEVRPVGAGLVLSGTVSGAAKVERAMQLATAYAGANVTNLMNVGGTQQVALKVRIAEMTRSAAKNIGVSTGLVGFNGRTFPRAQTGTGITTTQEGTFSVQDGFGIEEDQNFFENTALATAFGTFSSIFSIADNYLLDIQIDALEEKGFARLLAEPTLVALSGTEADFLAGGEVPVPAVDDDGNVDVSFKSVGVNVVFQPLVIDGDLINLAVSAEVTDVNPALGTTNAAIDITGFNVRRATTTIELRDGQSFAIAGLYEEEFSDTINQVPWLGDLPFLGSLFRSTGFQRGETELVIMVSVNLVTPVDDGDELALPTDRIRIPNERELFLLGNTVGGDGANITSTQSFDGAFGYVVE
ncbi:MAG: type II and III secretion system protein family protein [Pseudomonadota bacterium]